MSSETVFLSYVPEDATSVARLKGDLTGVGVSVIDRGSPVSPDIRVKEAVRVAVESASRFVLCLSSRDGLPPAYAKDEVGAAIAAGRPIIPVRLTRCDVPAVPLDGAESVADLDAIDLYDDWSGGVSRLISRLPVPLPPRQKGAKKIKFKTGSLVANHVVMNGEDLDMSVEGQTLVNGTLTGSNE